MNIGDEYLGAEAIGTEIANIQASVVPANVYFEIGDAEEGGGWKFGVMHVALCISELWKVRS